MWGTLGEEKALPMPVADGLLLAYRKKRYGRICEKNAAVVKYKPT